MKTVLNNDNDDDDDNKNKYKRAILLNTPHRLSVFRIKHECKII